MSTYIPAGQSAALTVMMRAAQAATKSLSRDFEELEHLQVSARGTQQFVQAATHKSADTLKTALLKARPAYGLLMEGDGEILSQDGQHRWIVHPLDGSDNFGHSVPHFGISIALERNEELVAGLVYDVAHQRCYSAEKGAGCFVNGQRLRVSGRRELQHALLASNIPLSGVIEQRQIQMNRHLQTALPIASRASGFRMLGATALDLAYVAAGKYDGLWLESCKPCEVAAGIVLVKEAGGYATPLRKKSVPLIPDSLIAGNPSIHKELVDILQV